MVEHSPHAWRALADNARILGIGEQVQIVRADALRFLAAAAGHFDVLFLDPPFHQGWIERLAPMLAGVLSDDAAIYVEAETFVPGCGDWRTVRHGHAGRVFYHLMQRGEVDGAE
jgi:16S rRNA (guanine966-N2)-methyltransferase